jgi:hypothetical protein
MIRKMMVQDTTDREGKLEASVLGSSVDSAAVSGSAVVIELVAPDGAASKPRRVDVSVDLPLVQEMLWRTALSRADAEGKECCVTVKMAPSGAYCCQVELSGSGTPVMEYELPPQYFNFAGQLLLAETGLKDGMTFRMRVESGGSSGREAKRSDVSVVWEDPEPGFTIPRAPRGNWLATGEGQAYPWLFPLVTRGVVDTLRSAAAQAGTELHFALFGRIGIDDRAECVVPFISRVKQLPGTATQASIWLAGSEAASILDQPGLLAYAHFHPPSPGIGLLPSSFDVSTFRGLYSCTTNILLFPICAFGEGANSDAFTLPIYTFAGGFPYPTQIEYGVTDNDF